MDQIVPSIIFNMKNNTAVLKDDDPAILAEEILRDLFSRATNKSIDACVQPILM